VFILEVYVGGCFMNDIGSICSNTDNIINQFENIFKEKFLNIKNTNLFYIKFIFYTLKLNKSHPQSYRDLLSAINEIISYSTDKEELKLIVNNVININTSMHNFNITSWGFIAAAYFWSFSIIINNAPQKFNFSIIFITLSILMMLLVFTTYCEYKIRKKCFYELVFELLSSRDK